MIFTNISNVYADDYDSSIEGQSIIECIRSGKLDFMSFINASVSNENFVDLLKETWKDLFFRNSCHALTVLSLLEQRNSLRQSIRDASMTCSGESTYDSDCGDGEDNDGDGQKDAEDSDCLENGTLKKE